MVNAKLMITGLVLGTLGLTLPVLAKLDPIPLPRLKPAQIGKQKPATPLPRLKPEPAAPEVPGTLPTTPVKFPKAGFFSGWSSRVISDERQECMKRLAGLDITYEPLAPFGKEGGCGAAAAIKATHVAGVAIQPPGEFTCDMAEALHGWIANSVLPATRQNLKKKLVKINNASAYVCRRRNNSSNGKLSEHAKANALDIATLGFDDGSTISIKGDWSGLRQLVGMSAQGTFLRQIRRDACIRFTTVLGPGSDAYHGDHFHIDVSRRKNGYRICK